MSTTTDKIRELIGPDRLPASDMLIIQLAEGVRDRKQHDHPRNDLYCLNLVAYAGEKMPHVLRRLIDAEARIEELQARITALADEATITTTGGVL